MMMNIKKEKEQSSLIHQKIKGASFVPLEEEQNKKFKYNSSLLNLAKVKKLFVNFQRFTNSKLQGTKLQLLKIDWKLILKDSSFWIVEAFVDGVAINFAAYSLLGWKMNFFTILAYGIVIKQGIDIYWRLKKDGSNTKIPTKDK